jgi:twinkle protein
VANSNFLHHIPCDSCGSSDAGALYSDDTAKCHGCGHTWRPDGSEAEWAPPVPTNPDLLEIEYSALSTRRISEATCRKFQYGIGTMRGVTVQAATYCDANGVPVAQKTRTADKSFAVLGKTKGLRLFGQHLWQEGGRKVVVTEGELDCMSVSEMQDNKWPVVSLPQGAQSAAKVFGEQLEFLESFKEVVLMFDMDEPGQKAALECAEILSPGKAHIATLGLKDPSEMLMAGRGPEIIKAMWDAKAYRPDGIVEGVDLWDKLKDQEPKPFTTYPYPELQELTGGWRDGEIVVVGAGTKIGKSTWTKEVAYHVGMSGTRVGIVALEEQDTDTARLLMGIHTNTPLLLDPKALDAEGYRKAFDEVMPNFAFYDYFGSLDPDRLIGKIRYLIKGLGCTRIILDHISMAISGADGGNDERRTIDKLMTDLASLGQETKAGIMVVTHLRKPPGDAKGYDEGRAVTLNDFRGSGSIAQIGYDLIGLERNLQGGDVRNLGQMRLLACRATGESGLAGNMSYERETSRLLPAGPVDLMTTENLNDF